MVAKGSAVGFSGEPSKATKDSVTSGFDLESFYANADESRSGLFTRSGSAALPGQLARDVVYSNSSIILDDKDCGTKRYLSLLVTEDMKNLIIGRYYLDPKTNGLSEIKSDHKLVGKVIEIRSPIHCISESGVCPICFGKLGEKLNTRHIGVMLGSIVNDVLLNKAMKARHVSSNVSMNAVNFKNDIIRI
ncbi:MAG: hypothetical protein H7836_17490 [Magnetococcus sp. YQC-3]